MESDDNFDLSEINSLTVSNKYIIRFNNIIHDHKPTFIETIDEIIKIFNDSNQETTTY